MTRHQIAGLQELEGLQVGLALADGTRIDDATLVSARVDRTGSLWLFTGGIDVFVPVAQVVDGWEFRSAARFAA